MSQPRYLYEYVQLPNCPDPADPTCEWMSRSVLEAASEDDVAGSGIFDVNRPAGLEQHIFTGSRGSLPGYAARERGDGPSEAIDQQTGTPTRVFLPGWRDGQQMLPSTQPRLPYPDPSLMMGDARELAMNGLGRIDVGNEWDTGGFSEMPTTRLFGWSGNPPPAIYGVPGIEDIGDASQAALPLPPGQQGSIRPYPPFAPTPIGAESIADATLARRGVPTLVGGSVVNPPRPFLPGRVGDKDISRPCNYSTPVNRRLYEVPLRPHLSSVLMPVPSIPLDQPCPAYVGRVPVAPPPAVAPPRVPLMVAPRTPGGTAARVLSPGGGDAGVDVDGGGIFSTPGSIFQKPSAVPGPSIFSAPPTKPKTTFSKTPKPLKDLVIGPKNVCPPGQKLNLLTGECYTPKAGGPSIFAKPGGPSILAKPSGGLVLGKPGLVLKPGPGTVKKPKQCHPGDVYDPVKGQCVKQGGGGAVYVPGAVRRLPGGSAFGPSVFARGPNVMVARPPVKRIPTMPAGKPVFGTPSIFAKPTGSVLRPSMQRPAMRPPVVLRPSGGFAKKPSRTCPPGQVFDPRVADCVARGGLWSTAPRGTYVPGASSSRIPVKVGNWKPSTTKGRPPPPKRSISPVTRGLRLSGLGEDGSGDSAPLWQWVVGGVVLGAAAAAAVSFMGDGT